MEEYFLYDCSGLVVRTTNMNVVMGVAKQILKGIAILTWYTHTNGGGTHFDFKSFAEAVG